MVAVVDPSPCTLPEILARADERLLQRLTGKGSEVSRIATQMVAVASPTDSAVPLDGTAPTCHDATIEGSRISERCAARSEPHLPACEDHE